MSTSQSDFVFAEHVLKHGYATDDQVEECLDLLARMRGEMQLDETLAGVLVKKGYLAIAQASVIASEIDPNRPGRPKNAIQGYRLLERVGGGAMGSVYRARHLKLDVDVALKVLRVSLSSSDTQIERLKREAQLAAKLNHPNIVRSLDVGESHGFHYLAMEFVEGSTVRQRLKRGPLKEEAALQIVRDVARGLEHAHAHGVVHRDVKPGNIMLTLDGVPKLADFGLARGQEPSDLTLEHASIGTPQYVAPEQMRRGADATAKSDLFSLGATLYHMVTGRPPFAGETLGEIVQNVLACRFPAPDRLVPGLSVDTLYVVGRLLRANPRERYPSATALLADLERIENGERIAPAGFRGDYELLLRRRRRRRTIFAVAAASVVFGLAGLLAWKSHTAKKEAAFRQRCRAAAGTARAGIAEIESAPEMHARIREMTTALARNADCGDLASLRRRFETARVAAAALEAGEAARTGADFRALDARLANFPPSWPGAARALVGARADLRARSDRAARVRYNELADVHRYSELADLLAALDAFAADLDKTFLALDEKWVRDARDAAAELREVEQQWLLAQRDYKGPYEKRLRDRRWNLAAVAYSGLHDAELEARAKARNELATTYVGVFFEPTSRDEKLERAEWTMLLESLPDLKPEAVVERLERFRDRAYDYRDAATKRAAAERQALTTMQLAQEERLNKVRQQFETYAQRRYYTRAAAATAALDGSRWLDATRGAAAALQARGRRLAGLAARFAAGAPKAGRITIAVDGKAVKMPGEAVRAAGKDLFAVAAAKPFTFQLEDVPRAELARVLAFRLPDDGPVKGEWLLAEASAADPRTAIELLDEATAHADLALVTARRNAAVEAAAHAEKRARQLFASMGVAREKRRYIDALDACHQLNRLAWTEFGEAHRAELAEALRALKRLAAGGLQQRRAGVPDKNFRYDAESGKVEIVYTGEFWHKYAGQEPSDVVDRDKWNEEQTRGYWEDQWKAQGLEGKFDDYLERATLQLLDWSGVEPLPGGGYAAAGPDNHKLWIERKEPVPATLKFPVRADRDWIIEFRVRWPGGCPGYFVVAVGDLQAGFGMSRKEHGGVGGVMLFEAESFQADFEKRWARYHWKMAGSAKKAKAKDGSAIPLLRDRSGANPFRMRLERRGNRVLFFVEEEGRWRRGEGGFFGMQVAKSLANRRLAAHVRDGGRRFRFMGLTPFELRDVAVRGILDTDGR